jgi:protein phosphatase
MNSDSTKLEVGALSETGYVRDENQDKMSWSPVPLGQLYIVADGMGGHKGGAVAAQIAVQELQQHINQAPVGESVDQVIQAAFKKANETVYEKAHSGDPATEGMGTTAVLLLISERIARVAHVGDSRAYLYRDGVLTQLTTDHTVVQKMVQAGMLKPEEAADHPNASVLERAIGSRRTVEVDIRNEPLNEGDAILLCSDGLSGYVTDQEIETVLRSHSTSQETATRLVELALQKGGKDNVTVQFVQYGPRKVQPVEPPKPEKPAAIVAAPRNEPPVVESTKKDDTGTNTASGPRHFSFYIAAGFVLGAAIVAAGSYIFLNKRTGELKAANASIANLHEELKNAKTANDKAASELATLKRRLGQAGESAKAIDKLQTELKKTETARKNAEQEVKKFETQLAQFKESRQAELNKVQNELKKSESARKTAESNLAALKQKLDEKERELQAAKTAKPDEPRKTTSPEGATAPKETSGTGDTTGQKETTEPKKN